jgi:Contractile injection system tape measure protein
MPVKNSHIIQNQKIEIEFEDPAEAMGIQNRIADIFYEKLLPKFDLLFNDIFGENYYAGLDNITIDCGIIENKNWENDLVETVLRKLKVELNSTEKKVFVSQNINETFFFFLEYGYLPWNSRIESIDEIEKLIQINQKFIFTLKELIKKSIHSVERLIYQFSPEFTKSILNPYVGNNMEDLKEIYSLLNKIDSAHIDERIIIKNVFKAFSETTNPNISSKFFALFLDSVDEKEKQALLKVVVDAGIEYKKGNSGVEENEIETAENRDNKAIYISNAGLAILHPFLPEFLRRLGLTANNQWINEEAQNKGALILEFLVNGTEDFPEFNLPLNKILCGIVIDAVVKEDSPINDEIKRESEELLKEVIKHWVVLKSTGINVFRESFLQRTGKLTKADKGWLLQVEQKGIDILLGKLPWGIGMIKLPWMKEILFVEWT